MEKNFPGVEYSVSFPRLRTVKTETLASCDVDDIQFVKIIALTRLQFPRVGINLSTREEPQLRDHLLEIGITRMSAGSNTSVGGYTLLEEKDQDPQFDIKDERSVDQIVKLLKTKNFDPVFTDWRHIENVPYEHPFEQGLLKYLKPEQLALIQSRKIGIGGAGGLGSNCAMMLVRTGFKHLEIIDQDLIDPSNLNRQQYFADEVGFTLKSRSTKSVCWTSIPMRISSFIRRNGMKATRRDSFKDMILL